MECNKAWEHEREKMKDLTSGEQVYKIVLPLKLDIFIEMLNLCLLYRIIASDHKIGYVMLMMVTGDALK